MSSQKARARSRAARSTVTSYSLCSRATNWSRRSSERPDAKALFASSGTESGPAPAGSNTSVTLNKSCPSPAGAATSSGSALRHGKNRDEPRPAEVGVVRVPVSGRAWFAFRALSPWRSFRNGVPSFTRFSSSPAFLRRSRLDFGRLPVRNDAVAHFVERAVARRRNAFDFIKQEPVGTDREGRVLDIHLGFKGETEQFLRFRQVVDH